MAPLRLETIELVVLPLVMPGVLTTAIYVFITPGTNTSSP